MSFYFISHASDVDRVPITMADRTSSISEAATVVKFRWRLYQQLGIGVGLLKLTSSCATMGTIRALPWLAVIQDKAFSKRSVLALNDFIRNGHFSIRLDLCLIKIVLIMGIGLLLFSSGAGYREEEC
jgi:hypothetical protein